MVLHANFLINKYRCVLMCFSCIKCKIYNSILKISCLNKAVGRYVACSAHIHGPAIWSGNNVPREIGVVRGEALRDALVPVHRWVSSDGSKEPSHGICVWVVDVKSLFTVLLLLLYFYSADMYGDFVYNVCYNYVLFVKMFNFSVLSLL